MADRQVGYQAYGVRTLEGRLPHSDSAFLEDGHVDVDS